MKPAWCFVIRTMTQSLSLVNPIGLEDWKALGVPSLTVDQWYARELKVSADGIRNYQLNTYYVGRWKPEYERWVDMYAGLSNGLALGVVAAAVARAEKVPAAAGSRKAAEVRRKSRLFMVNPVGGRK